MKRTLTLSLMVILSASGMARSQSMLFTYGNDPASAQFDWPEIKKCAQRLIKYPKPGEPGSNDMTSPEWRNYEREFQQITVCRLALLARHEGWTAATTEPDPYPPEPMTPEFGQPR